MRKTKKLVSYLILLAIPVAIAVALFVFNGSGYRLSEQRCGRHRLQKMLVSKLLRFLNQQSQNYVLDYMEAIVLVLQHPTIILNTLLMVSQDLF